MAPAAAAPAIRARRSRVQSVWLEDVPFPSVEQAWCWAFTGVHMADQPRQRNRPKPPGPPRPASPRDVYAVVERLHRLGRLTVQHLLALREAGELGRAPTTAPIAARWRQAVAVIEPELIRAGIVAGL